MNGNLLKTLLAKAGGVPSKVRAAMAGGDEAMGGIGAKFRSGGKGPYGAPGATAGGQVSQGMPLSEGSALELGRPAGGPMAMMGGEPGMSEKLKMLLARMTPEQKAALLGAGGGLAAGGLGGYMAGDEE